MQNSSRPQFVPGLEGVIAAQTRLSHVDGQQGKLIVSGFPVEEIAPLASFEEMVYLLWYDALPNEQQYKEFRELLLQRRELPQATIELIRAAAGQGLPEMDMLRMAAASLDLDISKQADADLFEQGISILARLPVITAAYWRLKNGQELVKPHAQLGFAANYLYMLTSKEPHPEQTRGLETYLNTVMDHGLNASTFTARVIISTGSDLLSAVVGAIGAMKGPLHGGAPGPALDMVFEIGEESRAEEVLVAKLERKERLMGFGHRIYKVRDPRAEVLSHASERFYREAGNMDLYHLVKKVEQVAVELLEKYKPGRNLQTNVEFYTALLLHGLGLPTQLFTPSFTLSRAAGWIAHCQEQRLQNRLIRPGSEYVGPVSREWVPLNSR